MSKLTILWLGIMSILASILILIYNGGAYAVCYGPHITTLSLNIPYVSPLVNCLSFVFSIMFLLMFVGPLIITLSFYAIYVIIFNHEMIFAKTLLWFSWLIFLYFSIFQLYLIPTI